MKSDGEWEREREKKKLEDSWSYCQRGRRDKRERENEEANEKWWKSHTMHKIDGDVARLWLRTHSKCNAGEKYFVIKLLHTANCTSTRKVISHILECCVNWVCALCIKLRRAFNFLKSFHLSVVVCAVCVSLQMAMDVNAISVSHDFDSLFFASAFELNPSTTCYEAIANYCRHTMSSSLSNCCCCCSPIVYRYIVSIAIYYVGIHIEI